MELGEAMRALQRWGTAQNRKVYARHGVSGEQFGVSYANLYAIAKKIKKDEPLAERLWATCNHDARILAMMVADPGAVSVRQLNGWLKDLDNNPVTGAFSDFVSKTPYARRKSDEWRGKKGEWVGRVGWNILASIAMNDADLPDAYFEKQLATIEQEIHTRKNRVRDAMNSALIAIGIRNTTLEKQALTAARRIGKVKVDHGETGCVTPDAAAYIKKTLAHRAKRAKGGSRKK